MEVFREEALPDFFPGGLVESNQQAAVLLDVDPTEEPRKIVGEIDGFLDCWQTGKRPEKLQIEFEDMPFALGSFWAEQLIRQFGWNWVKFVYPNRNNAARFGVVNTDRSLVVYPFDFVNNCLRDPKVDVKIELSFHALLAKAKWPTGSRAYLDLMQVTQRLIPRR